MTLLGRNKAVSGTLAESFTLPVSGGVAFAYGEVGYLHTDGTVRKSQRDGTQVEAKTQVICLSATIADGAAGLFRGPGRITGLSGGTGGSDAFVGATAGSIDTSPPAEGTGHYLTNLGVWVSSSVLLFNPQPTIGPM